jgi:hypothetical protein
LSNSSKEKKKTKSKRKVNWSEYHESIVRRGEMLFDYGFLQNWRAELKKMNKGKECANYRYPNSGILLCCSSPCTYVPNSILPAIRRLSNDDVGAYKETPRDSTRLHNHLVKESNKDKDKPRSKSKPRKRRYSSDSS